MSNGIQLQHALFDSVFLLFRMHATIFFPISTIIEHFQLGLRIFVSFKHRSKANYVVSNERLRRRNFIKLNATVHRVQNDALFIVKFITLF